MDQEQEHYRKPAAKAKGSTPAGVFSGQSLKRPRNFCNVLRVIYVHRLT